jgi:hypothetical protein
MVTRAIRLFSGIVSVVAPLILLVTPFIEPSFRPQGPALFDDVRMTLFALSLLTMFGFMGYAYRSGAVPKEKRALWIVVLFTANIFALPFFWYWYVREAHQTHESSTHNTV